MNRKRMGSMVLIILKRTDKMANLSNGNDHTDPIFFELANLSVIKFEEDFSREIIETLEETRKSFATCLLFTVLYSQKAMECKCR